VVWHLVDDGPKLIFASALLGLASLASWLALDRRSGPAARLRQRCPARGIAVPVLLVVLGLGAFVVVAEDVLVREEQEWVLRLDARIRSASRAAASVPELRQAASYMTRATGEGLAVVVAGATALLWWRGRRREAMMFLGGILAAWALSGILKVVFAVPRPSASSAVNTVTKYGFPSAHALVTTVAAGLGAWVLRHGSLVTRVLVVGVAASIVLLTATSRIVLNAHWLTDVVGGVAIGLAWVGVVLLVGRPRSARAGVPAPGARTPAAISGRRRA